MTFFLIEFFSFRYILISHTYLSPPQEIHQSAGSTHQYIAPCLYLSQLVSNAGPAITDNRTVHRTMSEFAGLVIDLAGQLTSWGDYEDVRRLAFISTCSRNVVLGEACNGGEKEGRLQGEEERERKVSIWFQLLWSNCFHKVQC